MNKKLEELITLDTDYILTGSYDTKEQNRIYILNVIIWITIIILGIGV